MPRYQITFWGRTAGAIGISYGVTAEREGETPDAAVLALYDQYEHIQVLRVQPATTDAGAEPAEETR